MLQPCADKLCAAWLLLQIDKQKAAERRDKVLGVVTLGLSKVAREIDREKGSEEAKASGGSSKDATRSVSPPADVNAASAVNKEEEDNPFALAAANIRRIAKPSKPGAHMDLLSLMARRISGGTVVPSEKPTCAYAV